MFKLHLSVYSSKVLIGVRKHSLIVNEKGKSVAYQRGGLAQFCINLVLKRDPVARTVTSSILPVSAYLDALYCKALHHTIEGMAAEE